jgi:hypothetical protein
MARKTKKGSKISIQVATKEGPIGPFFIGVFTENAQAARKRATRPYRVFVKPTVQPSSRRRLGVSVAECERRFDAA